MGVLHALALRSPTLPPATTTNCYLLGTVRLTVIDPAPLGPKERQRLADYLDDQIHQGVRPARVLLTHHHIDHIGAARWVSERYEIPIVAHPRTRDLLHGTLTIDAVLDEGDVLEHGDDLWQVLHTPGHASGHLCLHDPTDHTIVAGDMVAGEGTIVLDPPEGDLARYIASLERLRALEPRILLPAHGPPIQDAVALLGNYIEHRHQRTEQVRAALSTREQSTPADLVPLIYPDLHSMIHPIATRQVLCHLLWLAERNEVHRLEETWSLAC